MDDDISNTPHLEPSQNDPLSGDGMFASFRSIFLCLFLFSALLANSNQGVAQGRTLPPCDTNIEVKQWDQCAGTQGLYTGEFNNGTRHGWGEQTSKKTGNRYSGQYSNGRRHGWGIFEWKKSGNKYTGQFLESKRTGWGVFEWKKSGTIYTGQYLNRKRNGWG